MSNCQVEEELLENKVQHNSIDKDKISLLQFKNETNLNPKQMLSYTTPKKNNTSKQTMRFSDFIIDTLAIKKHISLTNKTTYTFRIYPLAAVAKPNEIYNLVYHKVNNSWETAIFYLKKFPKSNTKQKIFEKIERIYQGTVANSLTSKTTSLEMCTFETTSYHCTNSGECSRTGICDLCYLCTSTTITYESCASGGGSGGGGSSDPGNTSGGGGTADPYAYAPNFYDNPVYDDPNYINAVKRSYVWNNLGDARQGFFADPYKPENMNYFNQVIQYQIDENWSDESYVFANLARKYKFEHPEITFNDVFYNRTSVDSNTATDLDNNTDGGYDTNTYNDFNPQQDPWPNILSVIPVNQFIGFGAQGIRRNCMDYAKAQIAKKGYKISNYGSNGQTFKIYREQTGVNKTELSKGLSYLKYALSNGIPVIVGIDDAPGVPLNSDGTPGNIDLTTDHFIVIVGMGTNSKGMYFQFYDNASGYPSQGANQDNLLYYDPNTGLISGKSQTSYAQTPGLHNYIVTQIRKSKL